MEENLIPLLQKMAMILIWTILKGMEVMILIPKKLSVVNGAALGLSLGEKVVSLLSPKKSLEASNLFCIMSALRGDD